MIRALFLATCTMFWCLHANATVYTYTDLGISTISASGWMGINNKGEAAGATTIDGVQYATVYSNGSITVLDSFGGVQTTATSINDSGQVSGFSTLTNGENRPFRYSNGTMQNLGTLGGPLAMAFGNNNLGQVVGFSYGMYSGPHAFLYSNEGMEDLGTMGGPYSVATAINNNGQITGYASDTNSDDQPFIYSNGEMINIGMLDGWNFVNPWAINDLGDVAGYGDGGVFLYIDGELADIGIAGVAYDINNAKQVVGRGEKVVDGKFTFYGFLYSEEGGLVDLNSLLSPDSDLSLKSANGINDHGQILGSGLINGEWHDVILTPVPEPSSLALLGIALTSLAIFGRKRETEGVTP